MKTAVLALEDNDLIKELKRHESLEVIQVVPYSHGVLPVVRGTKPDIVVWSPTLKGNETPSEVIFQLTTLDESPQVIVLAGNLDKKDQLVTESVSSGIHDIVFNPPSGDEVLSSMVESIVDRILHPRNRKKVLSELGVNTHKHVPTMGVGDIQEVAQKSAVNNSDQEPFDEEYESFDPIVESPPEPERTYVVAVISPSSAGATFVASNVAATMALENFKTALIDFDSKRSLHHWFARDPQNNSFSELVENHVIVDEETLLDGLHAFTSPLDVEERWQGDVGWMNQSVEKMDYDVVVLDFSSGNGWREDLLLKALDLCDEVMFVTDMDIARCAQSRSLLDKISKIKTPLRIVMNKWDEEYMPCDITSLTPKQPAYHIPFFHEVYKSIAFGEPLVVMHPHLRDLFYLKELRKPVLV